MIVSEENIMTIHYEIIATGAQGNCIIINDVMVDCGVDFGLIRNKMFGIRYLLLTHRHNDHVNKFTLHLIKRVFPEIVIIGNEDVNAFVGVTKVASNNFPVSVEGYVFTPFRLQHTVPTTGYAWSYKGKDIIYATDTSSMGNAPMGKGYDYFFIESNHDIYAYHKIKEWAQQQGRLPFTECDKHLSRQEAYAFYEFFRKNDDAVLVELHKSELFYERDSFERLTGTRESTVVPLQSHPKMAKGMVVL